MVEPIPTRYARVEDEQRFVVAAIPPGATSPRDIEDRYLTGTRLRLRRVTDARGVTYKLGHKVRLDPARPSAVLHTTCYLDADEFRVLEALPAATLSKRRWSVGGLAADEFLGRLAGLVLLEGDRPVPTPPRAVEVTDDERFCGGALAALDAPGAGALLERARGLVR